MPRSKKTIVLVGHEAHRTGAPILLLNLVKWISENRNYKIYILLQDGGTLVSEYRKYAQVNIFKASNLYQAYYQNFQIRWILKRQKPDFIYFNTVASLKFHQRFKSFFRPFKKILHVHEMPFSIKQLTGGRLDLVAFNKVMVVNKITEAFVKDLVTDRTDVFLTPEYVEIKNLTTEIKPQNNVAGKKIILGVGVTSWRKGFDLFLQTAAICKRQFPGEFHFVWVGPNEKGNKSRIEYEIKLLGIADVFTLKGESPDVNSYYQSADLFFLSSREDPYPLVMIEAAYHKLPVLYFEQSGGAKEFFNYKPFEIPFGDCNAAALKFKETLDSISDYSEVLETFRSNALACDSEIVIPKMMEFIESNGAK